MQVAPRILARIDRLGRFIRLALPGLVVSIAALSGLNFGRETLEVRRSPPPEPGAPNVLLIVLDTVAQRA